MTDQKSKIHENHKANTQRSNRIQELRKRFSTQRFGKTQRTNSFLADPIAFANQDVENQEGQYEEGQVEPWLEAYQASDETQREERRVRKEINLMLGLEVTEASDKNGSLPVDKLDVRFFTKKLRKYQPANSSFSLFYGEKRGIERLKGDDEISQPLMNKPKFMLPAIAPKMSYQQSKQLQNSKASKVSKSVRSMSQGNKLVNFEYMNQLQQIDRVSGVLTDYSSQLIHKIDKASLMLHKKYKKLNQITNDMIEDVGTYQLQQQKNHEKISYEIPAWVMKKK